MDPSLNDDMFAQPVAATDPEAWAWAQRLIREVSEETARKDRRDRDFVRTWVRWNDLARFLSFTELCVMKRGVISPSERQRHETISSGLLALGGMLRDWAALFDRETLDLAGYSTEELETIMASIREGGDLWHRERSPARIEVIESLLPEA